MLHQQRFQHTRPPKHTTTFHTKQQHEEEAHGCVYVPLQRGLSVVICESHVIGSSRDHADWFGRSGGAERESMEKRERMPITAAAIDRNAGSHLSCTCTIERMHRVNPAIHFVIFLHTAKRSGVFRSHDILFNVKSDLFCAPSLNL